MGNEKIRVVHIISGLGVGGAETMLYQLIRFRKCENLSYKVISLGRSSYYEDLLDKLDCDVEVYDFTDHPLGSLIRIRKEIKENDIICSWMYAACIIGYFAGKNKAKRTIWCIRHSNLERRLNSRNTNLAINICKHLSRQIDVILYNGERSKRTHENAGFMGKESHVLENGCDITDYRFNRDARENIRRELGIKEHQLIVGSVSRFAAIKDVPTFIKAFSRIKKKNENAVALMCGQGLSTQNESLISLCNENDLKVGEDIILLGFRDDIAKIMNAIDIYILHSAGEAFPNSLIQAMACEKECIATDVGDARNILGDPELIVPVGDYEAIAEKAISILKSESVIHSTQNRRRIEEKYNIETIVERYEELYTAHGMTVSKEVTKDKPIAVKPMTILCVTNGPCSEENGMGNTLCNLFREVEDLRIANVYCHPERPLSDMDGRIRFYQITDKELVNSILKRDYFAGSEIYVEGSLKKGDTTRSIPGYDFLRSMRMQLFFEIREWIWKFGKWETERLRMFLDETKPDIIFQPIYNSRYLYDIIDFCSDYLRVPIVSYAVDDYYSMRQFSVSPLFWIDRIVKRQRIKQLVERSSILYVISDTQKEEYATLFKIPCRVLTKGYEFRGLPEYDIPEKCTRIVYGGVIMRGRYKSLKLISKAVESLIERGYDVSLEVYSKDIKNKRIRNGLSNKGTKLHEGLSYRDLVEIEKEASVLVHVEGLGLKDRFTVHQSFSTKLVDYFYLGKCIFAVGNKSMASIKHLVENDAAIIATSKREIFNKLNDIVENPECIQKYGKAAFECGKKWHDKTKMQDMLYKELLSIVEMQE